MLEGRAVQGRPASQVEGAASAVEGVVTATRTKFMATMAIELVVATRSSWLLWL